MKWRSTKSQNESECKAGKATRLSVAVEGGTGTGNGDGSGAGSGTGGTGWWARFQSTMSPSGGSAANFSQHRRKPAGGRALWQRREAGRQRSGATETDGREGG